MKISRSINGVPERFYLFSGNSFPVEQLEKIPAGVSSKSFSRRSYSFNVSSVCGTCPQIPLGASALLPAGIVGKFAAVAHGVTSDRQR
jgi:hypothetical protein